MTTFHLVRVSSRIQISSRINPFVQVGFLENKYTENSPPGTTTTASPNQTMLSHYVVIQCYPLHVIYA
jgi:hypothetical protein